ncbi:tRNA (N6-threonylcarbamoyladenosine(37)-N6)-methyltransferase TrmO [Shouchella lonarensis]|uniref:tRNA-Thr(GGU) m(6)t(6)A37 methyltransferase TsaA n=1 Tax=Shouchella lonarensis TaxID=1464122 RepID=A0A1G6GTK7_9BACI|nr:tRNA (N6-threonylcarbamoyladenosine(37)-N6)-methyltransferase TrmO [Shouchella lonarensis]SDB85360.1 tRNA-Thr(GGU) m(6)t(6)A37 methyltransferase TsaA [Shouchella lonarensis]
MNKNITLQPIGYISSPRKALTDDEWGAVDSCITLCDNLHPDTLVGLETFSHIDVLFYMHKVSTITTSARHPRGNTAWPKVGIFAQRAKNRPNQLGATTCQLLSVEGRNVYVRGLDAVDGTPILDIKPYVKEFAPREETTQPEWITELMRDYFVDKL